MIQIGRKQTLRVEAITSIGAYLDGGTDSPDDDILLPNNQLLDVKIEPDDELEVFVYRDSEDRIIATRKIPFAQVGEVASLEVLEKTRIGAFLNWGLEKDLFLPFGEQKYDIDVGKKYLVGVYLDKSNRLCATTNIYSYLDTDSPYKKGDLVSGTVYQHKKEIGFLIAIDDRFAGLIPNSEYFGKAYPGERLDVRVIRVREDGRLDVSPRKLVHEQMDVDSETILNALRSNDGFLPFHDKSDPAAIKKRFHLSKKAFKRAVGRLLKGARIVQTADGIRLK